MRPVHVRMHIPSLADCAENFSAIAGVSVFSGRQRPGASQSSEETSRGLFGTVSFVCGCHRICILGWPHVNTHLGRDGEETGKLRRRRNLRFPFRLLSRKTSQLGSGLRQGPLCLSCLRNTISKNILKRLFPTRSCGSMSPLISSPNTHPTSPRAWIVLF